MSPIGLGCLIPHGGFREQLVLVEASALIAKGWTSYTEVKKFKVVGYED